MEPSRLSVCETTRSPPASYAVGSSIVMYAYVPSAISLCVQPYQPPAIVVHFVSVLNPGSLRRRPTGIVGRLVTESGIVIMNSSPPNTAAPTGIAGGGGEGEGGGGGGGGGGRGGGGEREGGGGGAGGEGSCGGGGEGFGGGGAEV
eukprot:3290970-Prymnesium_polylepis.1